MRAHPRFPFVVGALCGAAAAQVPPHATWLNPTTVQRYLIALQDGDDVHAFGLGYGTLLHGRSRDGGRTWPLLEVPLGAYSGDLSFAATVAGPGTLLALGNDQYAGPAYWRSTDSGTTWSATAPLFNVTGTQGLGQVALLADGADVVAVWLRSSSSDVRARRSTDGGATWSPTQVLDVASTISSGSFLHCFRNGPVLDVLWNRNGSGAVHQRSTDGGATWLLAPRVVSAGVALHSASSDGTNLLVFTVPGFLHSDDGGATWVPRAVPGVAFAWSMAQQGGLTAVVGIASSTPTLVTYAVSVSPDGGLTWPNGALLLPSPVQLQTDVKVAGGVVYARFGPSNVFDIVTSRDAGGSWQLVGGPVSGAFAPGPQRNVHVVLEGHANTPSARWHAYVGLGSSALGSATTGAGSIAPRLVASGLPFQGATTTLQCSDAVGGSVGALAISFAPPSPLPFAGGTAWPTAAPLLFAFATGGVPSQPGAGAFALPIAVPVNPALVGISFTSQGVVVDGAAGGGLALTNALETWLR
jgi:hypothetical protein